MCALHFRAPAVLWSLLSMSTWPGFPSVEYLPLLSLRLGASHSWNRSEGQEQALSLAWFSEAPHFCPLSSFPGLCSCLRVRETHIMSRDTPGVLASKASWCHRVQVTIVSVAGQALSP